MRKILKEDRVDYKNYKFGYTLNIVLEESDSLEEALNSGYLPYTGDINSYEETYYMARSIRINLNEYERLSENKRVIKKIKSSHSITVEEFNKNDFVHNNEFLKFSLKYSSERFSNEPLSDKRLQLIIKRDNYNKIFVFKSDKSDIGYVLTHSNPNIIHYWFAFYDTKYLKSAPIGKFMMEHIIHLAKKKNKEFVYLGTCYGEESLYKVRDFKGIEFFDGNRWENDIEKLKLLCKSDGN
jgi:arginine-tRNA-protein transferase